MTKALIRLNNMKHWGFLKEIVYHGEASQPSRRVPGAAKKSVEDAADALVLWTAIQNKAILFTNDSELAQYAFSIGIYSISYHGLEDDIISVLKENDLQFDEESAIKKVKEYALSYRSVVYSDEDVRSTLEELMKARDMEVVRVGGRDVLHFRLSSRSKTGSSGR